jgi:tetratricopeptide (TPR) repeat protein
MPRSPLRFHAVGYARVVRAWACSAVALAVLLAALPVPLARAQQRSAPTAKELAQSRALVIEGNSLFHVGQFQEALKRYEAAYRLNPGPKTIFNMAQAQRQLKNHEQALFLYQSYLNLDPKARNAPEVEEAIRDLKAKIAEQRDAAARAKAAQESAAAAEAAAREAAAREAEARARAQQLLQPVRPQSDQAVTSPSKPWYRRWYVWVAVSAVVAGAVTAAAVTTAPSGRTAYHTTVTFPNAP